MNDGADISAELVERLKAEDDRYNIIQGAIEIESEIRGSKFLAVLFQLLDEDAASALEDLANATPTDHQAIVQLQARVYRARFIRGTFQAIRRKGAMAQESLERDRTVTED